MSPSSFAANAQNSPPMQGAHIPSPSRSSAKGPFRCSRVGPGSWNDPKLPEAERDLILRSHRFQRLFEEGYIRYHRNQPSPAGPMDFEIIKEFMRKNPQCNGWNLAATAVTAWNLADKNPKF